MGNYFRRRSHCPKNQRTNEAENPINPFSAEQLSLYTISVQWLAPSPDNRFFTRQPSNPAIEQLNGHFLNAPGQQSSLLVFGVYLPSF